MKNFLLMLWVVVVGGLLHLFLPWYVLAVAAATGGWWLRLSAPATALWAGLGGVLLWGGYAGWLNAQNQGLLANQMGELLGGIGAGGVLAATALCGGLWAALGGLLGRWSRAA